MLQLIKSKFNKQVIFSFFIIILFYMGLILIGDKFFSTKLILNNLYFDFSLYMVSAYIVYRLTKNIYAFVLLFTLFFIVVVFTNLLKIAFYGAPIFVDDVFLIKEVFSILDGFYFIALIIMLIFTVFGLFYSVNIKKLFAFDVIAVLLILIIPILFYPKTVTQFVKNKYGYIFWDQKINFEKMGPMVYLYQALARYQIETVESPSRLEVEKALNDLSYLNKQKENIEFSKRNVYVVLLESFWDASVMKDAKLSQDCFTPSFRKLIEQKQENFVLSPVFGGKTANAEFEILCGQPVTFGKGIVFQTSIHNDVECLPRLLLNEGYDVSVWHPNRATFFNRIKAYKKIGFENRYFKDKFDFKDKNGPFLSDKELYETVIKYNKQLNKPHFTYIMTITGHWGYPLHKKRKKIIKTSSNVKEVENYVNSIYYTSKEFMEFYKNIKQHDPEALVVVAGDHLPFLGANFAGYVESDLLTKSISDFSTSMYLDYASTPLLVLDGKNGKIDVGTISMYDIPHVVLSLLGYEKNNILNKVKNNTDYVIRAYEGLNLVLTKQKEVIKCTKQSIEKECVKSNTWIKNIDIISRDLFLGEQYSEQVNE